MEDVTPDEIRPLALMSDEQQVAFLRDMLPEDILKLDASFETWAQAGQVPPARDGWRVWLMMAGRGYGKTRAGAEWIHRLAMSGPKRRVALIAATLEEAREVMVEGDSGLRAVAARHGVALKLSGRTLHWPNGSQATLYSGDSPEGLRGPQFHFAWADELAKWRDADEAWDNLMFGLRLGDRARVLVTTTPRPRSILERIRALSDMVETGGRTDDNLSLSATFVDAMRRTYGGSRIGRQELDGELLSEAQGALFSRDLLERCRAEAPAVFDRVVVGVDPPAGESGDGCGIVVAGRRHGKLYVLADASLGACKPGRWASAAVTAAAAWGASHIVAEANQGGEMVGEVLKAAGAELPIRLVHASRGKSARAEPVATRFEAGRAFLAGTFPALEAELARFTSGGIERGPSPDRADAMVWALTELGEMRNGLPRVRLL